MTTAPEPARVTEQHINEYQRYHRHVTAEWKPGDPHPDSFVDWFTRVTGRPPATTYCLYTEDI